MTYLNVPAPMPYTRSDGRRSKHNVSARQQPEVTFSTLVQHRISAYITWPASDHCSSSSSSSGGSRNQVIGYRLRYQPTDNAGEFVSQNLRENFVLLENLLSGLRYRYQVKYLFENGGETVWSAEAIFDTSAPSD